MVRPILEGIHCVYEDGCEYPVAVRLLMDDNTVKTFNLDCRSQLQFQKVMDSLEISIGYQYTPRPRRRNRIHRWHCEHG